MSYFESEVNEEGILFGTGGGAADLSTVRTGTRTAEWDGDLRRQFIKMINQ